MLGIYGPDTHSGPQKSLPDSNYTLHVSAWKAMNCFYVLMSCRILFRRLAPKSSMLLHAQHVRRFDFNFPDSTCHCRLWPPAHSNELASLAHRCVCLIRFGPSHQIITGYFRHSTAVSVAVNNFWSMAPENNQIIRLNRFRLAGFPSYKYACILLKAEQKSAKVVRLAKYHYRHLEKSMLITYHLSFEWTTFAASSLVKCV